MRILKITALAAALSMASGAQAQTFQLERSEGDLIPASVSAPKSKLSAEVETQALHFAWALDPADELQPAQAYVAESREFWAQLDAGAAKSGFAFTPSAEGTLVRISRTSAAKSTRLGLADVQLRVDGQAVETQAAIRNLAGDAELKSAGAVFSEGTVVFELAPSLVGKRVEVALPKSNESVLMHVLEPNSRFAMKLKADRLHAQAGGRLTLTANFAEGGLPLKAERIAGLVTAPDGRSFDVTFKLDNSGMGTAEFDVPADAEGGMLPWEVHAFGRAGAGKSQVLRDARTGFQLGQASARLAGSAHAKRLQDGLAFELPLQAASTGRYELRGTLYGTDAKGELRPLAIAHTADLLQAGAGSLELRFPAELLRSALGAPYALRDLNLSDQSRMSLSEQRQRGFDLPVLPD